MTKDLRLIDCQANETMLELRQTISDARESRERSQGLQFTAMTLRHCSRSARDDSEALRSESGRLKSPRQGRA
jgi:hypothetical protein